MVCFKSTTTKKTAISRCYGGMDVKFVDAASVNKWRESGDWVALFNIINRGSTQISNRNK